MGVLFVMSAVLNLNVLSNLMAARRTVGLSRLNTLLLQLVLADLLVSMACSEIMMLNEAFYHFDF